MLVDGLIEFSLIQLKTYSNILLDVSLSEIFRLAILEIRKSSVSYIYTSLIEGSKIYYFLCAKIAAISLWLMLLILYSSIYFSNEMKSNIGFSTYDSRVCYTFYSVSYLT